MIPRSQDVSLWCQALAVVAVMMAAAALGQEPPAEVFPPAEPPFYRVRYEASAEPGKLIFLVNDTLRVNPGVEEVRGVIVHQHGCGEGSCTPGLAGAHDLHRQALARRHHRDLLAPAYEQPEKAECQKWCDPRNGSDAAFQRCLVDLGSASGHPELAQVPWASWGHSGGGHLAGALGGGMVTLHPDRAAAAWPRSCVPCIDAGFSFESWADPHKQWDRPSMTPDSNLDVSRARSLSDAGKDDLLAAIAARGGPAG